MLCIDSCATERRTRGPARRRSTPCTVALGGGGTGRRAAHAREHPSARRPHQRQLPHARRHHHRPPHGVARRSRPRGSSGPTGCGSRWSGATSSPLPRSSPSSTGSTCTSTTCSWSSITSAPPRTPPTTWWRGSPSTGCCSPATSSSTGAHRSCSWDRWPGRSWLSTASIELDPAVIVPGHGEVCGPEVVDVAGEYLRFLQQITVDGTDAGLTPLEAARQTDLGCLRGAVASRAHRRQPAPGLRRVPRAPVPATPSTSSPPSSTWSRSTAAGP